MWQNLARLRVFPLTIGCEATGPMVLPEYSGGMFRSGFGYFLRQLVCTTGQPECTGCPVLTSCPYSAVFETPVLVDKYPILRKYPNAPHPFVLAPPVGLGTRVAAGTFFKLGLTLVGDGGGYLPHIIRSLDETGKSGRFGGPYRVLWARSATANEDQIYCGRTGTFSGRLPALPIESSAAPAKRMRIRFLTPLRMRTRGEYNRSPDFVSITYALLHRIHLLTAIYAGEPDSGWMRPLLGHADQVRTEKSEFRLFAWDRRSGRQDRKIAMDGVVGSMEVSGNLTELTPFFRLGQWLHIGSATSMGLGKYAVEFDPGTS